MFKDCEYCNKPTGYWRFINQEYICEECLEDALKLLKQSKKGTI